MPKRLVFNDPLGVNAPVVGEEHYPLGFGPVHLTTDPNAPPGDGHQTVDNDDSFKCLLNNFTKAVVRKKASPLICEPPKPPLAKTVLPLRSKRLAAQSLPQVPASKRGEILICSYRVWSQVCQRQAHLR